MLAAIGRALAVRGEAVFAVEVSEDIGHLSYSPRRRAWKVAGREYRPEIMALRRRAWPLPSGKVAKRTLQAESLSYTSDMQRGQVRPGPVSLPSAWRLRLRPWRRGLSGV